MKNRKIEKGIIKYVISISAIILSLFHFYTAGFGVLSSMKQRTFHLGFILFLVFLLVPANTKASKERIPWYDFVFAILAIASNFYIFFMYDIIAHYRFGIVNKFELLIGTIAILLLMEGARRVVGIEIVSLMILAILYMCFGSYFPGFLKFRGIGFFRIFEVLAWTTEGVYGSTLGVSATYVYTFILFGVILSKTGLTNLFNDIAIGFAGEYPGGPAKVSIVSSALMGTVSGSAVSNVVTTGTFTIPLMVKGGYSPAFAAAVEAVSSTGGQIMPPVMGAAAFLIAEYLGIPYVRVVISAIIPALLYYLSLWLMIDLRARKLKLCGMNKEKLPSVKRALIERGYLLIPLIVIVYLLMSGFTPLFAVFYAIITALVLSLLKKESRLSFTDFVNVLVDAAKSSLIVASACGVVGIMVGMMGITGLGMVLGQGIISIAGGNIFISLVLVMVTCLLLGVGLPPTACYIVVATIAAPALQKLGILPLAAHFFVFYFGCIAVITPPVATASYTAAGMVGENPFKVGILGFQIGIAAYLIPFIFVTSPILLLIDVNFSDLVVKVLTSILGVMALATSVQGYFFGKIDYYSRFLLFTAAIAIATGVALITTIGIMILVTLLFINYLTSRKHFLERRS